MMTITDDRHSPALTSLRGSVATEQWPFSTPFKISRDTFTVHNAVIVTLDDSGVQGRGESCPMRRWGETTDSVVAQVQTILDRIALGVSWHDVHDTLPPGAARNAVDCAVWDLLAKRASKRIWELIGVPAPDPQPTVMTISVDSPDEMARNAKGPVASHHAMLKVKLGGGGDDVERIRAIRSVAPAKRLIVDANEAWTLDDLAANQHPLRDLGVEFIEQPLPVGEDVQLAGFTRVLPIGADESCHVAADVAKVQPFYDVVNIKLDKAGGLTEGLRMLDAARAAGLDVMVGCMNGTSLAMAPTTLIAPSCRFVDLDSPLLLGTDRSHALEYRDGKVGPPSAALWG